MPGGEQDALVDALHDEVGDGVRVVAEYSQDGYETRCVRDDVTERVSTYGEDVHTDLVLQGISTDHLEDLFGDVHTCSMHRFEELTAFHFVDDEDAHAGLFVSADSEADVPLASFSAVCRNER